MDGIALRPFRVAPGVDAELLWASPLAAAPGRGAVVVLPAMGVRADYYRGLLGELAGQGWAAGSADWRGNGRSKVRVRRGVDFGYRELVEEDIPAILAAAREAAGAVPLFVLGHSLGGQLAMMRAAIDPAMADGIALVASCSVYYKGWDLPRDWGVFLGAQSARAVARVLGYFPGRQLRFGGTEARTVVEDWSHTAVTGEYRATGSTHDFERAFASIRAPLLAISFEGDGFAPPRAVENLLAKAPHAPREHQHLTRADVQDRRVLHHFRWTRHPADVVHRFDAWAMAKVSEAAA